MAGYGGAGCHVLHEELCPYVLKGGTVVAIAGHDYAVIAADTRVNTRHPMYPRSLNKLFKMSPRAVLGSTGWLCDTYLLNSQARTHIQKYESTYMSCMSTDTTARMLSALMYNRRLFPYHLSNVLAGLDDWGRGVVYMYDFIGQYKCVTYATGGSSAAYLQPFLDNVVGFRNMRFRGGMVPWISKEDAVAIAIDALMAASERDIHTGDSVLVNIITKYGIEEKTALREY